MYVVHVGHRLTEIVICESTYITTGLQCWSWTHFGTNDRWTVVHKTKRTVTVFV